MLMYYSGWRQHVVSWQSGRGRALKRGHRRVADLTWHRAAQGYAQIYRRATTEIP